MIKPDGEAELRTADDEQRCVLRIIRQKSALLQALRFFQYLNDDCAMTVSKRMLPST